MRKRIGIDFDEVIMDTHRVLADFKRVLLEGGVPEDLLLKYYEAEEIVPEYRSRTMYLLKHPNAAVNLLGSQACQAIERAREEVVYRSRDYVFPDAWPFLEEFASEEMVIITRGGDEWQNLRIRISGVGDYCSRVILSTRHKDKGVCFQEAFGEQTADFIDDRGKYLEEVRRVAPIARTFWMYREGGPYNHDVPITHNHKVTSLIEVANVIRG